MSSTPSLLAKAQFSQYHFMGVVVPGAFIILGFYIHDVVLNGSYYADRVFDLCSPAFMEKEVSSWAPVMILLGLLFVIVLVGHIVASASSLFIDRMISGRLHGYPYETLLKSCIVTSLKAEGKRACNRLISIVYLLAALGSTVLSAIETDSQGTILLVIWGAFALLCAWILLGPKRRFRKMPSWDDTSPPPPSDQETWAHRKDRADSARRAANKKMKRNHRVVYSSSKLFRFVSLYRSLSRLNNSFPQDTQKRCYKRLNEVFGTLPTQTEIFWLPAIIVMRQGGSGSTGIHSMFYQYQMLRNLSLSAFLLLVYQVIWAFHQQANEYSFERISYISALVLTWAIFLLFRMRYWNIYYNWFSKTVFRAFILTDPAIKQSVSGVTGV